MLRVGLTGGIGSGKSTVAARLAGLGALVVDSDVLAREVVAAGSAGLAAVVERFGPAVLTPDGTLDRPGLGVVAFADAQARVDLERILHPRIAAEAARRMADALPGQVVVHDVPLLVEKGMGAAYHLVVVVHADADVRVDRLVTLRGMTHADARARVSAQADDAARRDAADVWLENHEDPADLTAAVDRLWHERLHPFNENLLARRPSRPRSGPTGTATAPVPPDPTWAAQGARLTARLARALGDRAVTVDHVGATAVPGSSSSDVVDLQVGVASPADADDPRLVQRLEAAGFPRYGAHTGTHGENPVAEGDTRWPERRHRSADPGRAAEVNVRVAGSPSWRSTLLLRDWLRSEPDERPAFGARGARAPAPEPGGANAQAEVWAARTGWTPPA